MIVHRKANSMTATIGRVATFAQVALKTDHSGFIDSTKAASAICDLVS
jgi:hypothetical protein